SSLSSRPDQARFGMSDQQPHPDDRGLAGKVAIVTGGGAPDDGIGNGRAAAILLARAGARGLLSPMSPMSGNAVTWSMPQSGNSAGSTCSTTMSGSAGAAASWI